MSPKSSNDEVRFSRIADELRFIVDEKGLALAAGGASPFSRSVADEIFCTLYDDLDIEGFLRDSPSLSQEEATLLKGTVNALNSVADELPEHVTADELFANHSWKLAQELALRFLKLVDERKS